MIKPDKAENPKIHSRRIDITTYEGDSESIVVEGVLHDERLAISYHPPVDPSRQIRFII